MKKVTLTDIPGWEVVVDRLRTRGYMRRQEWDRVCIHVKRARDCAQTGDIFHTYQVQLMRNALRRYNVWA